jgi:hypothetical protein
MMSMQVETPARTIRDVVSALMNLWKRKRVEPVEVIEAPPPPTIAGYNLVLMDSEGQVVCTREWDAGDPFEMRPQYRLWVFCEFTNHSQHEVEISEYEIELTSQEGTVVERFGNAFGDSVIVQPGQRKVFQGEWRM